MHQYAKFRQNHSIGCEDKIFLIFQDGGRPTFWIFEVYLDHPQSVLGVSITLQNLVMINAVVFII